MMESNPTIVISDDFYVEIEAPRNGKYIDRHPKWAYTDAIVNSLSEVLTEKNAQVLESGSDNFDYRIIFRGFTLEEYCHNTTACWEGSEGTIEVEEALVYCKGYLKFDLQNQIGNKIDSWSVSIERSESISHQPSFFESLIGTTYEENQYRVKELSMGVFVRMSELLSQEAATYITREIRRINE